jgi:homoserine kinase
VTALGLVAAALVNGRDPDPEELLAEGIELEGHGDNLAPALAGGACLTWGHRIARVADTVPAAPIALIPDVEIETHASRAALPASIPHGDAAFSAARSALLGAALASGSEDLFAAALDDRLHEPYRSPFLAEVREALPDGALGATLSGSGPSVIVWSRERTADTCREALATLYPDVEVVRLAPSPTGACTEKGSP